MVGITSFSTLIDSLSTSSAFFAQCGDSNHQEDPTQKQNPKFWKQKHSSFFLIFTDLAIHIVPVINLAHKGLKTFDRCSPPNWIPPEMTPPLGLGVKISKISQQFGHGHCGRSWRCTFQLFPIHLFVFLTKSSPNVSFTYTRDSERSPPGNWKARVRLRSNRARKIEEKASMVAKLNKDRLGV